MNDPLLTVDTLVVEQFSLPVVNWFAKHTIFINSTDLQSCWLATGMAGSLAIKSVIVAVGPLAISGCAFVSPRCEHSLSKVKIGATEAEARDILGSPQSRTTTANRERWEYEIFTDDSKHLHNYDLDFSAGHLSAIRPNSNAQKPDLELREKRNSSKQEF